MRAFKKRRGFLPADGWNSRFAISSQNHFTPTTKLMLPYARLMRKA